MSPSTSKRFRVVGSQTLHCAGCESSVRFAVTRLPSVEAVNADHKTQLIEVTWVGWRPDLDAVRAELDWMGYEVEEA